MLGTNIKPMKKTFSHKNRTLSQRLSKEQLSEKWILQPACITIKC